MARTESETSRQMAQVNEDDDIDVGTEVVNTTPRVHIEKHDQPQEPQTTNIDSSLLSDTSVIDITGDKGVLKKIIKPGQPQTNPPDGAEVTVHYVGTLVSSNLLFDSTRERGAPFKFKVGLDLVIKGWDKCVPTMNKGEICEITCQPKYGYGEEGCPPFDIIPPNATLKFEIELLDWKKPIVTLKDMAEEATKVKEEGNQQFKQQNYKEALEMYDKALDLFKFAFPKEDGDQDIINQVKLPCHLNAAACQIKLKQFKDAWLSCEKCLDIDSKNVKAIFRRGQAHLGLAEFDKAKADYETALKADPSSKELQQALRDLNKQEEIYKQKQKQMYSKMFG